MYISAPADNTIYAYNKVNVQAQSLTFTGTGLNSTFVIEPTIQLDPSVAIAQTQITVTKNTLVQEAGVDYTVSIFNDLQQVNFITPPNENDVIIITRKQSQTYTVSGSTTNFSFSILFTATDLYSMTVTNDGKLLRPFFDYTIVGTNVVLGSAISSGTLTINASTHWDFVKTLPHQL